MKQMQLQTITELKIKDGQTFEVVSETPQQGSGSKVYLLDGEVLAWHAGNRATRLMVGMGSGRETAKIHYWLDGPREREESVRTCRHNSPSLLGQRLRELGWTVGATLRGQNC